jgi:hypothetical protein
MPPEDLEAMATITSADLHERLVHAGHLAAEAAEQPGATDVWWTAETIVTVAMNCDPTLMAPYRRCYFVCMLRSREDRVPVLRDEPAFALPEPFRDFQPEPAQDRFLGGPFRWLLLRLVRSDQILLWPACRDPELGGPFTNAGLRDRVPALFQGLPADPAELAEIGAVVLDPSHPADCRLLDQVANDVIQDFDDFFVSDPRCLEVYLLHHHGKVVVSIPDEGSRRELLEALASLSGMIEDCSGYVSDWDDEDE